MATNYKPTNVSITLDGKPLQIHPGNVQVEWSPSVTSPAALVGGAIVFNMEGDVGSIHRTIAKAFGTPLIERTNHPMRFHRP
jgi:hypothetical protein